jgi:hypothetical protein
MAERIRELVSVTQNADIERAVVAWLNSYESKPCRVDYGFLGKNSGLAVGTIQSAFKVRKYINGGYLAQYQFELVYRLIASNADERITADELLNTIGEWMENNIPAPPAGVNRWKINRTTGAAHITSYDNGAEDHAIQMTIFYEVI